MPRDNGPMNLEHFSFFGVQSALTVWSATLHVHFDYMLQVSSKKDLTGKPGHKDELEHELLLK